MDGARENTDNLIRKRPAQRVGFIGSPWDDTLKKWVDQGYPVNGDGDPVDPLEHFGYDMCTVGGWFDAMPIKGFSEVEEETDEWSVTRNGAGASFKYWKDKSGTPEHVDFKMVNREIWERDYRPHLLKLDRERSDIEGSKKELARRRDEGIWTRYGDLFVFENMRKSMGDVCMYESFVLDPEWVRDYCKVYTAFWKELFRLLIVEAGKPDGIWLYEDLGYKGGLFVSPGMLEELIFPYYKEMIDFFHSYDLPVVLHSCGDITEAMPQIVDAGFDALNPMEVKAGCDIFKFAEQYADKLAFVGGLDIRVLESGDRELIKSKTIELINGMKERGASFFFGEDHSISTNVDYEDYKYAIEVYRDNMLY